MTERADFPRRALIAAGLIPRGALAQSSYPGQRPVSLVIPYAAGGIPDVFGNAITQGLAQRLGGTFVMDHKPGASTTLGTRHVARARPDGYTLLFAATAGFTQTPFVLRNAGYDPVADFTHLGMTGSAIYLYVAHPRWPSLEALVAAARRRPSEITYATWGVGSSGHLATLDLARRAEIEMTHIPYNGTAQALLDISAGRVDFMLSTLAPARPHLEAGRVRPLGFATAARYRLLPDVPTVAEQGFPEYVVSNWTSCSAPAGLPRELADPLEAALAATFADPVLLARLEPLGINPTPTGALAMRQQLARDLALNQELIRRAGIQPE